MHVTRIGECLAPEQLIVPLQRDRSQGFIVVGPENEEYLTATNLLTDGIERKGTGRPLIDSLLGYPASCFMQQISYEPGFFLPFFDDLNYADLGHYLVEELAHQSA